MNLGFSKELQSHRIRLSKLQGERAALREQQKLADDAVLRDTAQLDVLSQAIVVFQKSSEYARQRMKVTIDDLVTNALQVVFGGDLKFEVELGTRGGAPTADFLVVDGDLRVAPIDAKGGGLVDVISVAMRLAILELYEPKIDGPIMLDEPGKMVSAEYVENFVFFLKEYCHKVGRQFIVVTHNNALAAAGDRTFRFRLDDGASEVVQA